MVLQVRKVKDMYETYIVDELGNPKYPCYKLSDEEIINILTEHPLNDEIKLSGYMKL